MELGDERASVQGVIIDYAKEIGWEYISREDSLRFRGGNTGFVFKELFVKQLQRLNPDFMDHILAEDLIKRLERIPPNIEGNLLTWEYFKGLRSVFVHNENRERNVKFIDTENIERNIFHVTDEFEFTNETKTIRLDIVFFINGVPILFMETKAATKIGGISEAMNQVKRYHQNCPELLTILQIYALTNLIEYYYSATWNFSEKLLFNWKEEAEGNFETLVKTFLDKKMVIKVLTDFILFTRQDDELKKVVLRPHQMRAVNKLVERAKSEKRRGLVWHTQGSGKTYTMILTAKKILENPIFENPTVIMLVDRNELETQLFGNLAAVGFEGIEVAKNKKHLRQLLSEDRRGLIVSMIHKFHKMPQNINERDNIFVLVDEAHRTTGGKLGDYLMGALPNATYIGFTGTPIDKTAYGKGTFIIFGRDDLGGYIDKYSIAESIEDGTTVPLHYAFAPNELRVDRETLEKEFLGISEAKGVSDIDKLNKILERAVTLKNMLKSKKRIEKVAKYVANHYKNFIEPMGFKAFLVAVDREACALYKEELNKHLPEEWSKVVYSSFYNDPPKLEEYHLSEEEEKRIRKAFKDPDELPKILIVTEKLLTGFDAPILYCMYLDKPMRDHVLLQAIARVNRPYEDNKGRRKTSGFVLDFIGIFENLEKALEFDSQDVEGVIQDIKILKDRFKELIKEAKKKYLSLIEGRSPDKAVETVLEYFRHEEKRRDYYKFFREISDIYEIISPDKFLRPYIDDFETLTRMYRILKEAYDSIEIEKDLLRKTSKLVQYHTKPGKIKATLEIYEINSNALRKIEESKDPDNKKVFNISKSILKHVQDHANTSPYLLSIGEKAEAIIKLYKARQKSTEETLEELKKLIDEINSARKAEKEKKMPSDTFSIYWMLQKTNVPEPEDKAKIMGEVLRKYPHWKESEKQEREVKIQFITILLNSGIDVQEAGEKARAIMRVIKGGL
ncbi:type I restriction endonuclease subunit R [Methanothermobacter sp. KEPCO-1]|uniref:type I restriction endonuclease subunit R n=1 Tax=Methanothermobacter sp. KEPCO-1 TaxID=2603820 RepID=UPI0011C902B5|nr:type I restriction endonuclease subunit R [Methanothermobacter sp. KEPCO-1]QEF93684.1 type I restriction endonuclease subunit R [Methanothermobacter sp. KEPCO-1]QEF95298.1 type I restriction endonuclease subunit R [Methanothermobacter sp. KEPCO-1]